MKKKLLSVLMLAGTMLIMSGCGTKITVETSDASGITDNDAIVSGYIGDYEEMPTNVGIFFGSSEDDMEKIVRDAHPSGLLRAPEINVSYDITTDGGITLEAGTTYYYRFFARVDGKDKLGEIKSFTTLTETEPVNAEVETGIITDLTSDDAVIHQKVRKYEKKPEEVGLYFGESPDELVKVAKRLKPMEQYDMTSFEVWYQMSIHAGMTLKPETTYYYQCYARDGSAESRGEVKSFTTPAADDKQ